MNGRVRRAASLCVAVVLAAGVAGCAGSDDDESTPAGASASAAAGDASAATGEFDLLTYNVAGLPEGISGSHPATNMPLIGPKLNDYDVVLLQETWKTPATNPLAPTRVYHEILEEASTHAYRTESAPLPLGKDPSRPEALVADGLNVFSQYPVTDVDRQPWAECEGIGTTNAGDCLAFKGFAAMNLELDKGVDVLLIDTHLEAGGSARDESLRADDLDALATYIEQMAGDRAVILGGDMNLHTEDENPVDQEAYRSFVDRVGLTDSCEAVSCADGTHIDKVMIRNGTTVTLSVLSWESPADRFLDASGEGLSDHPPVHVRLKWTSK